MSKYKQSIQAFIDVIGAKIIPAEDFPDLLKVVEEMPEDDEVIAKEIDNWLKPESRSKIQEFYRVKQNNLSGSNPKGWSIFGGAKMEPGKESKSSKQLLINKIKKNTPEPKPREKFRR